MNITNMKLKINNKKIGIWGFGLVGRSVIDFFSQSNNTLELFDSRSLSQEELSWLALNNVIIHKSHDPFNFLNDNDCIIPSPGVDLRLYKQFHHKLCAELDIFAQHFDKKTIAITGSVGKTSITHILFQLLKHHGTHVATGGNIGTPMLSLLKTNIDYALLELSSFQLEYSTFFAPDIAIWTNFYPNHLDRHKTEYEYFIAKTQIIARQKKSQKSLLPFDFLFHHFFRASPLFKNKKSDFFFTTSPTTIQLKKLPENSSLFFIENDSIMHYRNAKKERLYLLKSLPKISFLENWIIICAALHTLQIPLSLIARAADTLTLPEHRLEKVTTICNVDFYNDSKSTTAPSTLAAVDALTKDSKHPIKLLLGGISKGTDRTDMIHLLSGKVAHIYCFGDEAQILHELCKNFKIKSSSYTTLDAAFHASTVHLNPGEQIVLSPGGASFDLFKNYQERGDFFKSLVKQLSHTYR